MKVTCEVNLRAHEGGKSHAAKLNKSAENRKTGIEVVTQAVEELKVSSFDCSVCSMTGEVDLRAHEAEMNQRAKLAKLIGSERKKQQIKALRATL